MAFGHIVLDGGFLLLASSEKNLLDPLEIQKGVNYLAARQVVVYGDTYELTPIYQSDNG